jgi:apolipoprotein N-acyltransferase
VSLHGATGWRAARLGYVTGAVSAVGLLYWTAFVVFQYGGGIPRVVAVLITLALCFAFAVFPLLLGWGTGRLVAAFGARGLLGVPFLWVATELLRVHTFFEFPWCLLGYSQQPFLPVIQIASVTAVYGVSFVVVASSALLAIAILEPRARRRSLVGWLALQALVWGGGAFLLSRPIPEAGRITVGLVQGGIRQEDKWLPENAWSNVGRHIELTREAARRGARLVVWPESAVPFLYDEEPALAERLQQLVRRDSLFLYFGNDDRELSPPPHGRIFVGAKLLDPNGDVTARYRKMHLVPFGEYVPLQWLFTLGGRVVAKVVQEVSDFSPGSDPVTGDVEGHRIGGYICYEAIFPDLVRRFPARGAELLVNITNDAWYGTTSAPYQHLAMAAFRAVENRRYMVRAANTGITAVVDPWGRIQEPTQLFGRAVLVREVPFVAETSFYTRHGDLFAQACTALALALLAATFTRRAGLVSVVLLAAWAGACAGKSATAMRVVRDELALLRSPLGVTVTDQRVELGEMDAFGALAYCVADGRAGRQALDSMLRDAGWEAVSTSGSADATAWSYTKRDLRGTLRLEAEPRSCAQRFAFDVIAPL